jgi:hypothetical protein
MTAATGDRRSFGLPGAILAIVGAALVLVAFRFLDWYDVAGGTDSAGNATFGKLRSTADQLGDAGAARAYFDWLSWVLVIALVVAGIAANLPVPAADGLRVVGFLVGLIGAGATYFAIAQLHNAQVSAGAEKHNLLYNSTWGLWTAFAGYLLGAIGAGLGPRTVKVKP